MRIAVSACLLGTRCRYDGRSKPCKEAVDLAERHQVESICPERRAGLSVPHPANEIVTKERALRVVDENGDDNTALFVMGAQCTVNAIKQAGCDLAVMKAKSPSCGCGSIYDGTFTGRLVPGYGVATRLIRAAGIRVIDEKKLARVLVASHRIRPGAEPALFATSASECPTLETERIVLRPMTLDDAEDVFEYCKDPDIGADAGWPVHRTIEDSRKFVRGFGSKPHVFGIFEKRPDGVGPCVGSIGLTPDERRKNVDCMTLGYSLAKWMWGQGHVTEAARELLRYAFEELALDMVSVSHFTFNWRSYRVIEKCGFIPEGVLRAAEVGQDGVVQNIATYSITAREWRALQPEHDDGDAVGR